MPVWAIGRKNDFLYPFGHGGIARIKDTMARLCSEHIKASEAAE